mmetsp:Transcript_58712/g.179084  ORF Transcript_58712/g.179084 Transcript_58712/m.179084 type:complete len:242 (+) Transcript_58712:594-1319(+)
MNPRLATNPGLDVHHHQLPGGQQPAGPSRVAVHGRPADVDRLRAHDAVPRDADLDLLHLGHNRVLAVAVEDPTAAVGQLQVPDPLLLRDPLDEDAMPWMDDLARLLVLVERVDAADAHGCLGDVDKRPKRRLAKVRARCERAKGTPLGEPGDPLCRGAVTDAVLFVPQLDERHAAEPRLLRLQVVRYPLDVALEIRLRRGTLHRFHIILLLLVGEGRDAGRVRKVLQLEIGIFAVEVGHLP